MARRLLNKRRKEKPTKVSKSVYNKTLGNVPALPDHVVYDSSLWNYLNWFSERYRNRKEIKEGMVFVAEYMKTRPDVFSKEDIKSYKSSNWMWTTGGMIGKALLFTSGKTAYDGLVNEFHNRIREAIEKGVGGDSDEESEIASVVEVKPTVRERTSEVQSQFVGEILGMIDDGEEIDLYILLQGRSVKPAHARALSSRLTRVRDEIMSAIRGDCDQLVEAYSCYSKKELKEILEHYTKMVADCERHAGNVKAAKAPRKKKVKSAAEQTKKVVYLKQWPDLQLVSIDPTNIIGARELLTYNVRYKTLTRYVCSSADGFRVRGTTLDNIDSEQSEYRALRKPEKTLGDVLKGTKTSVVKTMTALATKRGKPNGRINEHTLILRTL